MASNHPEPKAALSVSIRVAAVLALMVALLLVTLDLKFGLPVPAETDVWRLRQDSAMAEAATAVSLRVSDTHARVGQYALSTTMADQKAAEDSLAQLRQMIATIPPEGADARELMALAKRYEASVESTFAAVERRRASTDRMLASGTEIRTISSAIALRLEAETDTDLVRSGMALAQTFEEGDAASARFLASRNPADSNIAARTLATMPIRVEQLTHLAEGHSRIRRFIAALGKPLADYTASLRNVVIADDQLRHAADEREAANQAVLGTAAAERARATQLQQVSLAIGTALVLLCMFLLVPILVAQFRRLQLARRALRKKSLMLEMTLANMDQGLIMVTADGTVGVLNDRARTLLALPPELMRGGVRFSEVLDCQRGRGELADDADDMWDSQPRSLADGVLSHQQRRSDGTVLEIRSAKLPGGGMVRTYTDVTQLRLAEEALHRSKERAERAEALSQGAIDSIDQGFAIYDAASRLLTCNDSYRRLYPADAPWGVPGVTFAELMRCCVASGAYPDAFGREEEWLDARIRRLQEATGETEELLHDGRWMLVTNRRMRNGDIVVLRMDITALKQAQMALRDSEAHLSRAQEIAGIGSWELDIATGRFTWSRQLHRISGLPPDTAPTLGTVAASAHPDDFQAVPEWLEDLRAGREPGPVELRIERPGGETRLLRVEGRRIVDATDAVRRLAGTMQDITERRMIDRQLSQAQKMEAIGNLTGGMAHDFNNVLGVIIGNIDLLKRLVKSDTMASELCGEVLDGATRCADLIQRLLAFARRQPLRPERTDMNSLINNIGRLLVRTLGEDIALKLDLDATVWPVMVDPSQLEAALVNLATNARDAMPKGGQLDITTRNIQLDEGYAALHPEVVPGDYAAIEVTDNGHGMPPDVIAHIFEPFFTTKGPGKGTGLGLSMVFGFVKQSSGHLSVYSEPGVGTTFRLCLPRMESDVLAPASAPEPDMVTGGDETVLVVEDNAQLRRAATRQLTELGYQVREAEHAAAALAILSGGDRVDLLFTDVVMPGTMDGPDLARQATQLQPEMKVLLTSGFPGVRGTGQRMPDSPFPLLNKPYRRDVLARAVRELLDQAGGKAVSRVLAEEQV